MKKINIINEKNEKNIQKLFTIMKKCGKVILRLVRYFKLNTSMLKYNQEEEFYEKL
ncbi:hypothetical protein [Clostridium beijerinckii]|uniref:hypothetical protein n=1 Tax=Clostridium beijerinckii TaxID=1520 RepID=UPI001A9AC0BF|nr:hypothetical protein [Clostridium beijerinckii]NRT72829.1 hypothetical protein [Clostridium beijerinckii]